MRQFMIGKTRIANLTKQITNLKKNTVKHAHSIASQLVAAAAATLEPASSSLRMPQPGPAPATKKALVTGLIRDVESSEGQLYGLSVANLRAPWAQTFCR